MPDSITPEKACELWGHTGNGRTCSRCGASK